MAKNLTLREKILNSSDLKTEIITIKEWDVDIEVKGLTGKARAKILQNAVTKKGTDFEKLYPQLVIATSFCPLTHKKIFEDTDKDLLNGKSGGALEKIAKLALKLSGLDEESVEKAEKN